MFSHKKSSKMLTTTIISCTSLSSRSANLTASTLQMVEKGLQRQCLTPARTRGSASFVETSFETNFFIFLRSVMHFLVLGKSLAHNLPFTIFPWSDFLYVKTTSLKLFWEGDCGENAYANFS